MSDGISFLRGCCHAHCADRRTWHASQGDELLSCESELRGMNALKSCLEQLLHPNWKNLKKKGWITEVQHLVNGAFANRTGPSCHLQCEQLGRCLSQLPRWEGFGWLSAFLVPEILVSCRHL